MSVKRTHEKLSPNKLACEVFILSHCLLNAHSLLIVVFIYLFIYLFVSFIYLIIYLFNYLFIHWFIHSFIYSFIYLLYNEVELLADLQDTLKC